MIALDTNILVYALNGRAVLHGAARDAIQRLADSGRPFGVPVFTIGEFLRVVTHPALPVGPRAVDDALTFVDRLLEAPGAVLLSPGPRYWRQLREAIVGSSVRGNAVFDAQIASVCLESGVDTILTEDKGFRRFDGIRVRTLAEFAA